MNTTKTPPTPGKRSKILEETLQVNQVVYKARTHIFWGCINAIVLSIISYDIFRHRRYSKIISYLPCQLEIALAGIFLINSLFHFVKYIIHTFNLQPVCLSPSQKKLLGVKPSDPLFKTYSTPKVSPDANKSNAAAENDFSSLTPMNLSALSWLSPSVLNDTGATSPNYSMSSSSWIYHNNAQSPSFIKAPRSPIGTTEEFISDERSLNQYIHDYEEHEKKASVSMSVEQPSNLLSFWNNSSSRNVNEVSPLLRRCTYQLAPLTPVPMSTSPGVNPDEGGSPSVLQQNQEVWRRLKVDPTMLTQWNANLRMWISQTILQRLVKEFDNVDEAFQRFGLSDMHLGSVGLERLKKTASIPQVAASIPSLPRLVPFLEISPHQEYLVARIRELAKGGSMSEYRWNSGGSLNGKNWEEHLPTDAAIVMHLIATYLDSQLLPMPHHPDGRPFTTNHFVRTPEKPPKGRNALIIYQVQLNPPHFVLVENDDSLEVAKGRNNLFHTFLLFLHLLKTKEHGMLGRVNLGPSGVNILWVIDG